MFKEPMDPSNKQTPSLSWFSCGSSILVELEFAVLVFVGGRKPGEPGEKPLERGENKNKLKTDMAVGLNRTITLFPCCNYKLTINGLTTGENYGLDKISDFYFLL